MHLGHASTEINGFVMTPDDARGQGKNGHKSTRNWSAFVEAKAGNDFDNIRAAEEAMPLQALFSVKWIAQVDAYEEIWQILIGSDSRAGGKTTIKTN